MDCFGRPDERRHSSACDARLSLPRLRREVSAAPRARRRTARDVCGAPAARRDSGCAGQWESRDPLPIAPCHAGRRRSTVLQLLRVSSQTIGCQTAARSSPAHVAAAVSCWSCIVLRRWVKRERPTWLMAQVGRVEPLRSGGEGDALWRVPSEPGPCTFVSCVERSVPEPARPAQRHVRPRLLSVVPLAHSRPARSVRGVGGPQPTGSHCAYRRARASREAAVAGVPSAFAVELGEHGHGIVRTNESVRRLQR